MERLIGSLGILMLELISIIEKAFERISEINTASEDTSLKYAIDTAIDLLDQGKIRVAEKKDGEWIVNQWVKKAVLLAFKINKSAPIDGYFTQFYDKLPLKFAQYNATDLEKSNVRIVPHAIARKGAYIAPNTILMPSYVNIGAYIGTGTMVDTWVTVGSCAQIGNNVHLSGGVGIGGVLEPLQANPTIIEDNVFVGARSEIVEGVIVEKGAVISMGVFIGQSTKIYDRETGKISYGRVPSGAVVVPGNLPSEDGSHSLYCAVIVKRVDEKTRAKVGLTQLLRE